jgi:hypothetical protein
MDLNREMIHFGQSLGNQELLRGYLKNDFSKSVLDGSEKASTGVLTDLQARFEALSEAEDKKR